MIIPQVIQEIVDFLKDENLQFSKKHQDGRLNASINEDELLKRIKKKFPNIQIPKSRAWYDFAIEIDTDFYPINIKITDTKNADNLSCKLGIYYALTGIFPDFANEINWENYFKKLKENFEKEKNKDYYFLVVNKEDTNDIFCNTLKHLEKLVANGNNLPFQCKWDINRVPVSRTFEEAKNFIMETFAKSIKLSASTYFHFQTHFSEYDKE